MKKIIVFIFLLIGISLYSDGYDFSVGAGYGFGYQYSFGFFDGFYREAVIPLSLSFYPDDNEIFSIGFKNKIGYRYVMNNLGYSKDAEDKQKGIRYHSYIVYDSSPIEHQFFNDFSLLIKVGTDAKFVINLGCITKYSLLYVPDYNFDWGEEHNYNDYSFSDYNSHISTGTYGYFSYGPSLEIGLQLVNKPKTICVDFGIPVEILIPVHNVSYTDNHFGCNFEENKSYYYYSWEDGDNHYYKNTFVNFAIGFQITLSFYTYKKKI